MNPETPLTPRDELEARVTALLMGELPPAEAAAIQAKMVADPELAALHGRLRKAMEILRELSALPEQSAPPTPVQLSSERRERLLAHFKTSAPATAPAPPPIVEIPRRDWSWVLPMGIAAALVALLGTSLMAPVYSSKHFKTRSVATDSVADIVEGQIRKVAPFRGYVAQSDADVSKRSWASQPGSIKTFGEEAKGGRATVKPYALYSSSSAASNAHAYKADADANSFRQESQAATALIKDGARTLFVRPAPASVAASPPTGSPVANPVAADRGTLDLNGNSQSLGDLRGSGVPFPGATTRGSESLATLSFGQTMSDTGVSSAPFGSQNGPIQEDQKPSFSYNLKDASGLEMKGSNTFTGGATINGGTLSVTNSNGTSFGGNLGTVTLGSGATNTEGITFGGGTLPKTARRGEDRVDASLDKPTLSSIPGVDLFTAPRVTTKSGQSNFTAGVTTFSVPVAGDANNVTINGGRTLGLTSGGMLSTDAPQPINRDFHGAPAKSITLGDSDRDRFANEEEFRLKSKTASTNAAFGLEAQNGEQNRNGPATEKELTELSTAYLSTPAFQASTAAPMSKLTPSEATPGAKPMQVAKLQDIKQKLEAAPLEPKQQHAEQELPLRQQAPAAVPPPEIATSTNAFSTFSLNVSDVSFKLAAASLEKGQMPEPGSVRSEEFINAFDYRDPEPAPGAPLGFAAERARYPFAQNRDLLRFSVKTAAAGRQPGRPLNIVLLLDKSGSMERADRVNIVREALRVLAAQLQPRDMLSIVTFARTPRLWADGVAGDKAGEMIARVGEITPEGGTNLEAALDLGYATALRHYAVGSISRVVLFTDGAANLGDVNPDALKQKVEAHRQQGVALDCFGIGWEGYNDDLLEQLTRNGDGRYGFINTPEEAAANFAAQLAGALRVAASDVKVQVEFNPRRVTAYRQVGYARHQLTKEQFRDNTVDAAEIGAAESGNALYVVEVNPRGEGDLATVRVRFRVPGTSDYREHEWTVPFTGNAQPLAQASPALRLAGTAGAFSEMLAASPYAAEVTSDHLLGLLNGVPAIYGADPRPQKLEWMIRQARSLSGR